MLTKTKLNPKEALIYIDEYHKLSKHTVDENYLQNINLRVFFKNNIMMGGYCLNKEAPFRYSMLLSPKIFNKAIKKAGLEQDDIMEITCMWIKRTANVLDIMSIYDWIAKDTTSLKKKHLIGASTEENIAKYFRRAMPHLLYHGAPLGAPHFKEIWLYSTHLSLIRPRIWFGLSLLAPKMTVKFLKRSINKKAS